MKQNINRSVPSKTILILFMCMALPALAIGVFMGFAVKDGLVTGQIYSITLILDINKIIYRSSSPTEYWTTVGFYIFTSVGAIVLGILMLVGNMMELKRKIVAQKRKNAAATKEQENSLPYE